MVYMIRTHTSDEPGIGTFRCSYCGGETFNDDRGNCCACGAPRKKIILKQNNIAVNMTITEPSMDLYMVNRLFIDAVRQGIGQ
jgi:ribosomal protein L37E